MPSLSRMPTRYPRWRPPWCNWSSRHCCGWSPHGSCCATGGRGPGPGCPGRTCQGGCSRSRWRRSPNAGVPGDVFEGIKAAIVKDRYAYFKDFFDNFYNVDVLGGSRISEQAWQASFNVAAGASPYATYACVWTAG
jgi:hypothetical protein